MRRGLTFFLLVCSAGLGGCGGDNVSGTQTPVVRPSISTFSPAQVSLGQKNITGSIQGTSFSGVVSVSLGDGITVEQVTGVSAVQIDVRFSVSATAAAGVRTITVTTSAGSVSSNTVLSVIDNSVPTAKFKVTPQSGAKNTEFIIDGSESSDPDGVVASYLWDFHNGETDRGRIVRRKFNSAGTIQITLKVTDDKGGYSESTKSLEVLDGIAPVARYSVSPAAGDIGTLFKFDGSASSDSDGTIKRYDWKFGDGGSASGMMVEHEYSKDGQFSVLLTVTDNDNLSSVIEKSIRVSGFDPQKDIEEIQSVLVRFFSRFSRLENLSSDVILEDWSRDPTCPGYDREKRVIEENQVTLQSIESEIIGDIPVIIKGNRQNASADVLAEFTFVGKDGVPGSGVANHNFDMILEGDSWVVCNFRVEIPEALRKILGW